VSFPTKGIGWVENVKQIQRLLGAAWTSVKFYFDEGAIPDLKVATDQRFCQAVLKARSGPLLVRPEGTSCPGARYVFGWDGTCRDQIVDEVIRLRGATAGVADTIVSQVPTLDVPPVAIGLNSEDVPDLIISYCQPKTAMEFLKLWQTEAAGRNPMCEFSSILSVCGNVSVGCYLSDQVSLSFGCDNARESANIGRDRLIIGIPYRLINRIVNPSR
jgi:uncharacterized protein (DUF169 family)